jgi:hypothetical protein
MPLNRDPDPGGQTIDDPYVDGYWWNDQGGERQPKDLATHWPSKDQRADFDEGWRDRDAEE